MPLNFKIFESNVNNFNDIYHTNFSLEKFHNDLNDALSKLNTASGKDIDAVCRTAFRDAVKELYRQAADYMLVYQYSICDTDIDLFDSALMKSFAKDVITPYQKALSDQNFPQNDFYKEMSKAERYSLINEVAKSIPSDRIVTACNEYYAQGKLTAASIRDFGSFLESSDFTDEAMKQSLRYANAVRERNGNRSFFWKFFHPVQNYREKKLATTIEKTAADFLKKGQESGKTQHDYNWYKESIGTSDALEEAMDYLEMEIDDADKKEKSEVKAIDSDSKIKNIQVKIEESVTEVAPKIISGPGRVVEKQKNV